MKKILAAGLLLFFVACNNGDKSNTSNSEEENTKAGNVGDDTSYPKADDTSGTD